MSWPKVTFLSVPTLSLSLLNSFCYSDYFVLREHEIFSSSCCFSYQGKLSHIEQLELSYIARGNVVKKWYDRFGKQVDGFLKVEYMIQALHS